MGLDNLRAFAKGCLYAAVALAVAPTVAVLMAYFPLTQPVVLAPFGALALACSYKAVAELGLRVIWKVPGRGHDEKTKTSKVSSSLPESQVA